MNFSKRNGRDSINQNSQFFSVTVQFTEWAVCSKRKSLSLENVSSACMLSFTFRIEAGRKYSSWQISDAHCSGFHFKKQHKPLLVQAKPNLNFNFKKTSCYAQKPNTALFCFFFPLIVIMSDPRLQILIAQAAPYVHAISVIFCALWSLIGSIHSSKVNHLRPGKWQGLYQ